jgi:hypothetical protein
LKRAVLATAFVLALAGCPGTHDQPDAAVDAGPAWQSVVSGLDGALLSVWGTSPNDVWAVGGPRGTTPFAPIILHYDGSAWTRMSVSGGETYWWVHGSSANDVWFVGENGRITHWDGAKLSEMTSGTKATIFGVWAASPTDAWAVGGTPVAMDGGVVENDVVLHWDGGAWTPAMLPMKLGRSYFKVWGASADDVFVVGEASTIWRRSAGAWTLGPQLAHGTLLTVHGCSANEVYAVGGRDVLKFDGSAWSAMNVTLTNDVNGVSCGPSGSVVIVGFGGLKQRLVSGAWQDDFGIAPNVDLHGAWSDGSAYWAVGGDFISNPTPGVRRNGTIARYGAGTVSGAMK